MSYVLILNNNIQFEKNKIFNDLSIFTMILFELIKYKKDFYIIAKKEFYNKIIYELNNINYLINNNINVLIYETDLDNYQLVFLLSNLIFTEMKVIPLNDFNFDNNLYNIKKRIIKITNGLYTKIDKIYRVYIIKSDIYRSKYLINTKKILDNNKFCMIEYFINHKKNIIELFFNKVISDYKKYNITDLNIDILNKIIALDHYKLITYNFL